MACLTWYVNDVKKVIVFSLILIGAEVLVFFVGTAMVF